MVDPIGLWVVVCNGDSICCNTDSPLIFDEQWEAENEANTRRRWAEQQHRADTYEAVPATLTVEAAK